MSKPKPSPEAVLAAQEWWTTEGDLLLDEKLVIQSLAEAFDAFARRDLPAPTPPQEQRMWYCEECRQSFPVGPQPHGFKTRARNMWESDDPPCATCGVLWSKHDGKGAPGEPGAPREGEG